jgi:hypothetical protein
MVGYFFAAATPSIYTNQSAVTIYKYMPSSGHFVYAVATPGTLTWAESEATPGTLYGGGGWIELMGVTPIISIALTPCWTPTPVSTFTTTSSDAGNIYYNTEANEIIANSWLGANLSLRRLNAQMTPIAVATYGYLQMSNRPRRSDGNLYLTIGQPSGQTIKVYNIQLTPVGTVNITTYAQPIVFDRNDNGFLDGPDSNLWKLNSNWTPVATVVGTKAPDGISIDSSNNVYVGRFNGNVEVYNNQLTPIATFGSTVTQYNYINLTSDDHILQGTRTDNYFKVWSPYPTFNQDLSWTVTNPRGAAVDKYNNLWMWVDTHLNKYTACYPPTNTYTITLTATQTFTATKTITATQTPTPTATQSITPTMTPWLEVTFVSTPTNNWVRGSTVNVYLNWILHGYSGSSNWRLGEYAAIGGAGTASNPSPAATMIDSPLPHIVWIVTPGTNLSGTYNYSYTINANSSYQVLGMYWSGDGGTLKSSQAFYIVTATSTTTRTVTPTSTATSTLTVTPYYHVEFTTDRSSYVFGETITFWINGTFIGNSMGVLSALNLNPSAYPIFVPTASETSLSGVRGFYNVFNTIRNGTFYDAVSGTAIAGPNFNRSTYVQYYNYSPLTGPVSLGNEADFPAAIYSPTFTATVISSPTVTAICTPAADVALSTKGTAQVVAGDNFNIYLNAKVSGTILYSRTQIKGTGNFTWVYSQPTPQAGNYTDNYYYIRDSAQYVNEYQRITLTAMALQGGSLTFTGSYYWLMPDSNAGTTYGNTLILNAVTPTYTCTVTSTYTYTATLTHTVTYTFTNTPADTPVCTPTNTPAFYTSIYSDHPGNWILGEKVKVFVRWSVTGGTDSKDLFSVHSENSGEYRPAGLLSNPTPQANIESNALPSLYWYLPVTANPSDTYNYYYKVTSTGDGAIRLKAYMIASDGGPYAESTDVVHIIVTETPTMTATQYSGSYYSPTATRTTVFATTNYESEEGDWMLGDKVFISVSFTAENYTPLACGERLYLKSVNVAGYRPVGYIDSYYGDNVSVLDNNKPDISWLVNASPTPMQILDGGNEHYGEFPPAVYTPSMGYYYSVTAVGTGYFRLESYLYVNTTGTGVALGLTKGALHRIVTATETITCTPTMTATYSCTDTITFTMTPTYTISETGTGTPTPDYTPADTATLTASQKVYRVTMQYMNGNRGTVYIAPYFRLYNVDSDPIELSKLKVRYWFKAEGTPVASSFGTGSATKLTGTVDITSYITGSLVPVSQGDQNMAYDVTFLSGAGSLGPGEGIEIKPLINNSSANDETNDWSSGTITAAYVDTGVMNAYYNVNGSYREIYGQAPVDYRNYSVKVDCAGAGYGGYSQDRAYAYGGWGLAGNPSNVYNYSLPIKGASDSGKYIYQSSVIGSHTSPIKYVLDNIPDGKYEIKFKFAEIRPGISTGGDLNNIYINGQKIYENYDVYGTSGFATACDLTVNTVVASCGQLVIEFEGCSLAGFEVNIKDYVGIGTRRGPSPMICQSPVTTIPIIVCGATTPTFTPTQVPTATATITPQWTAAMIISSNPVVAGKNFTIWLNGMFSGNTLSGYRLSGFAPQGTLTPFATPITTPEIVGGSAIGCRGCYYFYAANSTVRNGVFYDRVTITANIQEDTTFVNSYWGNSLLGNQVSIAVAVVTATITPGYTSTQTLLPTATVTYTPVALENFGFRSVYNAWSGLSQQVTSTVFTELTGVSVTTQTDIANQQIFAMSYVDGSFGHQTGGGNIFYTLATGNAKPLSADYYKDYGDGQRTMSGNFSFLDMGVFMVATPGKVILRQWVSTNGDTSSPGTVSFTARDAAMFAWPLTTADDINTISAYAITSASNLITTAATWQNITGTTITLPSKGRLAAFFNCYPYGGGVSKTVYFKIAVDSIDVGSTITAFAGSNGFDQYQASMQALSPELNAGNHTVSISAYCNVDTTTYYTYFHSSKFIILALSSKNGYQVSAGSTSKTDPYTIPSTGDYNGQAVAGTSVILHKYLYSPSLIIGNVISSGVSTCATANTSGFASNKWNWLADNSLIFRMSDDIEGPGNYEGNINVTSTASSTMWAPNTLFFEMGMFKNQ